MGAEKFDTLDELLLNFRPIEQLFRVMGSVDAEIDDGLARQCSEIGLMLASNFREHLERAFTVVVVGRGADTDR